MLTLKEIENKLSDRNLKKVSELTKVAYTTLIQIKKGNANPTYKTIQILSEYLSENN